MKDETTAVEMLEELYGKKETYTYFEAAEAMIKYAYHRCDNVIDSMAKEIDETFNLKNHAINR